ncbi:MAG: hypothetical protein EOR45_31575 [Mesorhizobium sp.]|nr:MAG: hypothetical protein EOR45_31575 [Mesorhizobium sp.]
MSFFASKISIFEAPGAVMHSTSVCRQLGGFRTLQNGDQVSLRDFRGKVVAVAFIILPVPTCATHADPGVQLRVE